MLPELGHYALILALVMALVQAVVPLLGAQLKMTGWMSYGTPMVWGQFFFVSVSLFMLGYAFVTDDFSVAYVASNSNTQLPTPYKISAVWGGHEGSLLLWVWILAAWSFAVTLFSRSLPEDMLARVVAVLGMVSVGFLSFVLHTSNPFNRILPQIPREGSDLNPLLQDFGLIVHPPMLYMGYVGFSVAFAFAIAALISGRLDTAWARWSRPWTSVAWAFLTLGIALGSWWAYYELGWGGWWFWDPVENASLMPWLVGTALMHSLAVTEKRGVFKNWTVLLAIFAFSLSLLGTFLVRSGVLTSVHAFATDPERGYYILALLAITIGGSFVLYALRAPDIKAKVRFTWMSREAFLLVNNIMLVIVMATVLLGTIYPLILDALGLGKISVGPPYFNALFVPLMSILAVFMGLGPASRWKNTERSTLIKRVWLSAAISVVAGAALPFIMGGKWNGYVFLGMMLALWIFLTQMRDIADKLKHKGWNVKGLMSLGRSYWGMVLGHVGAVITVVGMTLVANYTQELDARMLPGSKVTMGEFQFELTDIRHVDGPNWTAEQSEIRIWEGDKLVSVLYPQKRRYTARNQVMTEASIDWGLFRDLYVAMGEPLEGGAWAVRVQHKPFVRWLWIGGVVMTLGGLLAAFDKRYRQKAMRQAGVTVQATESENKDTGAVTGASA
ncbi:heme lyase CcmF/NrfE family subunit [Oceanospirillum multiglobuliferum]